MIDLTTYALLRKQIATAASGISDVRAEGDELVFVLADGHEVRMAIPATEIRDAVVRDDVLVLTLEDDKEIVIDTTLTKSGQAADAKATGDVVSQLKDDMTALAPAGATVGQLFRVAAISADGKYTMEPVDLPSAPVQDVQVNGASIVTDGVADVPVAYSGNIGLVRCKSVYGIAERSQYAGMPSELGVLQIAPANNNDIRERYTAFKPVTPYCLDYAVKAAMCDGNGAAWTAEEQAASRERMGIDKPYELIEEITMEEEAKIIRENEPNGTNYNFKSFLIIGETPVISAKKYVVILINNRWAVSFTLDINSKRYFAAKIYIEGGRMFSSFAVGYQSDSITNIQARTKNSFGLYAMNAINKFETQEDTFPIGTTIKLYGVRA